MNKTLKMCADFRAFTTSPGVEGMTGKYFYNSHVTRAAPQATDMAVARKLWEVSAELVHLPDGLSLRT